MSLNKRRRRSKVLDAMSARPADLLLMLGDNVYGDRDGGRVVKQGRHLPELRSSFADLARRPDFIELLRHHPVMAAWDDHDYGLNDGGRDFIYKEQAERLHEAFWGLDTTEVAERAGTYYARSFGPLGARLQVVMLDTRTFRSALTKTDQRGQPGKERYVPSQAADQDMLGSAQWQWLADQLNEPADLRVIASSVQILPTDGHGFESWSRLPAERSRLLSLVEQRAGGGMVFVSGDRHRAFLYRQVDASQRALSELTSSSINLNFSRGDQERDRSQVGMPYLGANFGELVIDWSRQKVNLIVRSAEDQPAIQLMHPFKR